MPAKITEYTQVIKATDAATPALKSAGDSVQTFAGKLKALRSEAAASGELGAERLFRNPERLLGLLTGQGLGLAISSFAFRELAGLGENVAAVMERIRKGEEDVAKGMLDIAAQIPVLGEAVKAGESIGKLVRLGLGLEDPDDVVKSAKAQAKRIEDAEAFLRGAQERSASVGLSGLEKQREEVRKRYDALIREGREKAKEAAKAAEEASRKANGGVSIDQLPDVPAEGEEPEYVRRNIIAARAKVLDAGAAEARKAAALAARPYLEGVKRDEQTLREELDRLTGETVAAQNKDGAARAKSVRDNEENIAGLRTEFRAKALESLGLHLAAETSLMELAAAKERKAVRDRYAALMEPADQEERIALGQQQAREEAAIQSKLDADRAAARLRDKEERAKAAAERLNESRQHAEAVLNVERDVTRQRVELFREQAENGNDQRAQRVAAILAIHEQYRQREVELNRLLRDGNATMLQRLQILGLVKANRAEEEAAVRRASQAAYEQATGFGLDANVGASYFQAMPRQVSEAVPIKATLDDPDALTTALVTALKTAFPVLGAISGVYAGAANN